MTAIRSKNLFVAAVFAFSLLSISSASAQQITYYDFNTPQAATGPAQSSYACSPSSSTNPLFCFNGSSGDPAFLSDFYPPFIDPNASTDSDAGSTNYAAGTEAQQNFSITSATQTVTFTSNPPSPAAYGGNYTPTASGGGSIVVIGSPTGLYGFAFGEHAYSASKGGCHALARVMAGELAPLGIRVNIVVPGFIDTRMNDHVLADAALLADAERSIPLARVGQPAEVAGLIAWLTSPDASYATGGYYPVDGGQMCL